MDGIVAPPISPHKGRFWQSASRHCLDPTERESSFMKLKEPKNWIYRKQNFKYLNVYSKTGLFLLFLLLTLVMIGSIVRASRMLPKAPMISPVVNEPVSEVKPSYKYVCQDDLYSFLMCEYVKGNIGSKDVDIMYAIAKAESSLRSEAININKNGTIDRGIFQINSVHKDLPNEKAFNWIENTKYAIKMMKRQGYRPWVAYNSGAYIKHLPK